MYAVQAETPNFGSYSYSLVEPFGTSTTIRKTLGNCGP